MAKLNIKNLVTYHKHWREELLPDEADEFISFISLSRKLIFKAINNNGELSGITLSYPEDCSNYEIFCSFLEIVFLQNMVSMDDFEAVAETSGVTKVKFL